MAALGEISGGWDAITTDTPTDNSYTTLNTLFRGGGMKSLRTLEMVELKLADGKVTDRVPVIHVAVVLEAGLLVG